MNKFLSKLRPAKSIEINQHVYELKRKGEKVITLSLGEAFFDIPDFGLSNLDHSQGYHYCDTRGLPNLRSKILEYYKNYCGVEDLGDRNILISSGSKMLIFQIMKMIFNEGDKLLLHEPAWLSYEDQATLCGAKTDYIPYTKTLPDFVDFLDDSVKLVVINNPNNPAGSIYSRNDFVVFAEEARKRNIFILVDEAYSEFIYPEAQDEFSTAADLIKRFPNVIVVNSISKNFGMSGWRIAFSVADQAIIDRLEVINQHTVTCAPTVLQMYLSEYLFDVHQACKPQILSLLEKRKAVESLLEDNKLPYLEGKATFYIFVDISASGLSSEEFSRRILSEHNVAVVPGSAYGRTTDKFVRISIGTERLEDIQSAIELMASYQLHDSV